MSAKAKTPFEHWRDSYLTLRQTRVDLDRFMEERYEHFIRVVAHEYWDGKLAAEYGGIGPCSLCKVNVSSIVTGHAGWYCEWECQVARCDVDGTGWYTPLPIIEKYLATHAIT